MNDPDDPGSATNRGITQATYDAWRARKSWPKRDVRSITDAEVEQIYEAMYWDAASCSQYDPLLGIAVFDCAVHSGVSRAVRLLQLVAGTREDGLWGPKSAAALRATIETHGGSRAGIAAVISAYLDRREEFLREVVKRRPKSQKYLDGWLNRLNDLRKRTGLTAAVVA